ncbi:MAG: hypothetical protein ROR55_14680 [Devosia sp.]
MIDKLYVLATGLILVGFAMLCQPLSQWLYSAGFPVLVVGVVAHIILDHVPRRAPTVQNKD